MFVGRVQDAKTAIDGWRDGIVPLGIAGTNWRSGVNYRCDAFSIVSEDRI